MKDPVRAKVDAYGLEHILTPDRFFPTIKVAVTEYQRIHQEEWSGP
jgi:hypothetical protein